LIRPYVFLNCRETNFDGSPIIQYSIKNIQWIVDGYNDAKDFLDINGIVAVINRNKIGEDLL
jgi:hypothetical protein